MNVVLISKSYDDLVLLVAKIREFLKILSPLAYSSNFYLCCYKIVRVFAFINNRQFVFVRQS